MKKSVKNTPVAVVLVSILGVFSAGVSAQQSIEDAITQCSSEKNSLQRLVCFDRVAKNVRQYTGVDQPLPTVSRQPVNVPRATSPTAAPRVSAPSQATQPSQPAMTAEQEFGIEHKRDTDKMIDKLYAVVTKLTVNQRRKRILTLDNGQTWQQQDSSTLKVSVGDTIYVERGVLGAFYLSNDDVNKRMKVKRVN